jgi:hypothetical protein
MKDCVNRDSSDPVKVPSSAGEGSCPQYRNESVGAAGFFGFMKGSLGQLFSSSALPVASKNKNEGHVSTIDKANCLEKPELPPPPQSPTPDMDSNRLPQSREKQSPDSLFTPVAFTGVFKQKTQTNTRSQVDMNELAHPVYAPAGCATHHCDMKHVDNQVAPPTEQIIRSSPFG